MREAPLGNSITYKDLGSLQIFHSLVRSIGARRGIIAMKCNDVCVHNAPSRIPSHRVHRGHQAIVSYEMGEIIGGTP